MIPESGDTAAEGETEQDEVVQLELDAAPPAVLLSEWSRRTR